MSTQGSSGPTHRDKATQALVYPEGYRARDVVKLSEAELVEVAAAVARDARRAEAARRIYEAAPVWRQINDLIALMAGPTHPEYTAAVERRAAIDMLRKWSNEEEVKR